MKIQDIREKTDVELERLLEELRKESFQLRIQAKLGQLQKTARPSVCRRDIARVLNEQRARAIKAKA